MIVSNTKKRTLKANITLEELFELMIRQQKERDKVVATMLAAMNKSLLSLEEFNAKIAINSKVSDAETARLIEIQQDIVNVTKALADTSTDIKSDGFTNENLSYLADKISESINSEGIVESLESINEKLEPKEKEWDFSIIRDANGRMKTIKAKTA